MQQSQAIQNQTVHLGVQVPHEAQFRQFVVYERAPPDEGLPILDSDSSCINKPKSTISLLERVSTKVKYLVDFSF